MSNPHSGTTSNTRLAARGRGYAIDSSPEARIGRHIEPQPNGCWLYKGRAAGYVTAPSQRTSIHRWVYEILVGPIDEGCHVHHECETKGCCNPAHLLVLTPKEHAARHRKSA